MSLNIVPPKASKAQDEKTTSLAFSYGPLLIDYALRWIVLELWRLGEIASSLFWVFQILVISVPFVIWSLFYDDRFKKKHNLTGKIEVKDTGLSLGFIFLIVFSGCYITFSLYPGTSLILRLALGIGTFFVYGLYSIALYTSSYRSPAKEKTQAKEREQIEALDSELELADANNIRIVRMEAEISSISQRVESYTLESALFGALSFSGFLTLICSEKPVLEGVRGLLDNLAGAASHIVRQGFSGLNLSIQGRVTDDNLMAAVTLETIVCSMLFLSVIVSRLRFYAVLKQVDYAVRVARAYNDKEDEAYNLSLQLVDAPQIIKKRLESLSQKVADAIDHAEPLFRDLSIISNYMWSFRNLGLASFVLILITSAFLLSKQIGWLFVTVSAVASVYTTFDKWSRGRRISTIPFFRAFEKRLFRISRPSGTSDVSPSDKQQN